MNLTPRIRFTFHYRNPSRRNPEPLQRSWGTHPQLNRGLPNLARSFTTRSLRGTTNHLGYTMHPRGTSSWYTMHPRVINFSTFNFHESSWREQTNATNARSKTTQGGQVLHSQIQPKQLMLGRDLRGRTRRNTKQLQNLDLLGSPHLEEEWIGGMVDLDLLSCFPKNGKNHWREVEESSSQDMQQWRRERGKNCVEKWGRRPLFIGATKSGRWRGKNWGSPTPRPRAGQHPTRLAGAS